MLLLKSQRAEIFNVIEQFGIGVHRFKWVKQIIDRQEAERLEIDGTDFSFLFVVSPTTFYCKYTPGKERPVAEEYSNSWGDQFQVFIGWLQNVSRELSAPDPWAELERTTVAFPLLSRDTPDSPLNVSEFEKVSLTLDAIKKLLVDANRGGAETAEVINTRFEELREAAKKQGRRDLFKDIIFFIAGIAAQAAIPPEVTRQVFETLKAGLSGVITLIQ